jgi:hypothetical protein
MGVELDDDGDIAPVPDLPPLQSARSMGLDASTIRSIVDDVTASADQIPAGSDGAIIGSYTKSKGWIGAVVVRTKGDGWKGGWHVKGFVGQEKGKEVDFGVGVVKTFKF